MGACFDCAVDGRLFLADASIAVSVDAALIVKAAGRQKRR